MAKTAVIGAGSWGLALAKVLDTNGNEVIVWSRSKENVKMLETYHEHRGKLSGVRLSEQIQFTSDIRAAAEGKDYLILAVPSVYTRNTVLAMTDFLKENQVIVCTAKGIEEGTLLTVSEVVEDVLHAAGKHARVAVMCGPSHAEEVGRALPTAVVAGAKKREVAEGVQDIFMNEMFRVYTSPDVLGMELGGSLKNVIALAAGMIDGLGYGDNTKAALITRGISEMSRLALKMGANAETLSGLTGIGDLIVTCQSKHSRNRKAGMLIGQGYTMQEAMDEVKMVVEGVYSAKAAVALAEKYEADMPIIREVNAVLFEGKSPREAVLGLMLRDKKSEHTALEWTV